MLPPPPPPHLGQGPSGSVAQSMARQYAVAILNFMDFCKKQRFTFPEFSLAAVLEYTAECKQQGAVRAVQTN